MEAEADGETRRFTCAFLYLASGYYDYDAGYRPEWPGEAAFAGRIVHPQHWPDDLAIAGKRIVVIGSGATAVTLAPALAEQGAKVTMLQRSPSYVVSRPSRDRLVRRIGPGLTRWKNVLLGAWFFKRARSKPDKVRAAIRKLAAADLPPGYDIDRHFSPAYNPWDQRVCLIPDADLFKAIGRGEVEIVTEGSRASRTMGSRWRAGPNSRPTSSSPPPARREAARWHDARVDGEPIRIADHLSYKGAMLSDVPNLAVSFGYTNASWTLKSDLTARWVGRLLNHMDREGAAVVTPMLGNAVVERKPMLDFSSGYVQRAQEHMPKQGTEAPWKVHQNYPRDVIALRFGKLDDGVLRFSRLTPAQDRVT